MSWHYSQALVAAYSAGSCSGGKQFVLSKLMRMQQGCSRRVKTTGAFRLSRFGTTLGRSTGGPGGALLTWFLADSRARTSAWRARGPGSPGPAPDSGGKWHGSLARYDRDTCSWRIHQRSLFGDWELFSGTWPRWGSMRNGECWAQSTPVRRINGSGYGSWGGLWQTPTVQDAHGRDRQNQKNGTVTLSLLGEARMWPTPCARDWFPPHSEEYIAQKRAEGHGMSNLNDAVALWPTPAAHKQTRNAASADDLVQANGQPWVPGTKPYSRKTGKQLQTTLADAVMFPTPKAQDAKNSTLPGSQLERDSVPGFLLRSGEEAGGSLNPTWVEWLMGWPLGWTDCAASATDRCRQWCDSHGSGSQPPANIKENDQTKGKNYEHGK